MAASRPYLIGTGFNPRQAGWAESSDGVLYMASGTQKVQRWQGGTGQLAAAGVVAPTTAVTLGLTAGTAALTTPGSYTVFVTFVRSDGLESALSPEATITVSGAYSAITYTAIPVSTDSRVTARRIYRSTGNQSRVVYLDVTLSDNTTTTSSSIKTDDTLQTETAYALLTDDYVSTSQDHSPPPDYKPFLAWFLGRLWAAGEAVYAEGSVAVASGSTTVTGTGTAWTSVMAGRYLHVAGASAPLLIASVDTANQTLTLSSAYADLSDRFAAYAIRPPAGDARGLAYSMATNPEWWPPYYTLDVPDDGDEVTGLMPMGGFLYILKRRHVYRVTVHSDPAKDGAIYLATARGCVNDRCFVVLGEDAIMLDEQGIHRFAGTQESTDLSIPIEDVFRGTSDVRNVNWSASRYFHAVLCPREYAVRFFVCMGADRYPRHCLVYQYGLGRWWVERFHGPVPAAARAAAGRSGSSRAELEAVFLGQLGSAVALLGGSPLDGTDPDPRLRFYATGASILTVAAPGTLPDAAGAAVAVVAGRGKGQVRRVASVSGTTVTLSRPWAVLPDVTSIIQIGGVAYRYESNQFLFAGAEAQGERSVRLRFRPRAGEQADVLYYSDFEEDAVPAGARLSADENMGVSTTAGDPARTVDLSKRDGTAAVRLDGHREGYTDGPQSIRLAIEGVSGTDAHSYSGMILKGVS